MLLKPRMAFFNKMDRIGADFKMCVNDIKEKLGANPVPIQLPIGAEDAFEGIIDLIEMKETVYLDDKGQNFEIRDIRPELADEAEAAREFMIESVVECDDELMEKYLGGEEVSNEEVRKALRAGTIGNMIIPVLCGTAFRNRGIQPLLDAITAYMPAPTQKGVIKGTDVKDPEKVIELPIGDDAPFAALAFKVMTDPFVGRLTFFRVYTGIVEKGSYVLNSTKGQKERMGRLLQMHANKREEKEVVYCGDIAAVVGLKNTTTGDTLCDEKNPIILEKMEFPDPVISVAVEPKTKADQEKMGIALAKHAEEDPTFRVKSDEETGQTIISGMGELHLDIIVDRMRREFKVESITGKDFEFVNEITGGAIPREYIPEVEKGC